MVKTLSLGVAAWVLAGGTAFADVQLTINNGVVSIVAKDATVRQILTEWARVGQTKIVNLDRIPGGPISLELKNVPEEQALDVLLRSVSGFMAAPRPQDVANLSRFDRIMVMPTSVAPRAAVSSAPPPPSFQQQQMVQPVAEDDVNEAPQPPGAANANRGPVFNTFPQPQVVNQPGAPVGVPGGNNGNPGMPPGVGNPGPMPAGVSVPGMIVAPPPSLQGTPGNSPGHVTGAAPPPPGTPGQPIRRPGGQQDR